MLADYTPTGHVKTELTPLDTGCWLVTTVGSQHLWDLDAGTYERLPGEGRASFAHDARVVAISRVQQWPAVGSQSVVWFDDPDDALIEQWRVSSTIASIQQVRRIDEQGPGPVPSRPESE